MLSMKNCVQGCKHEMVRSFYIYIFYQACFLKIKAPNYNLKVYWLLFLSNKISIIQFYNWTKQRIIIFLQKEKYYPQQRRL
jgi:hypothetical protein